MPSRKRLNQLQAAIEAKKIRSGKLHRVKLINNNNKITEPDVDCPHVQDRTGYLGVQTKGVQTSVNGRNASVPQSQYNQRECPSS